MVIRRTDSVPWSVGELQFDVLMIESRSCRMVDAMPRKP